MKKIIIPFLILLAFSIFSEERNVVVLLDTSLSMLPVWNDASKAYERYIEQNIQKETILHILTFNAEVQIELIKELETSEDFLLALTYFHLLVPLGRTTDIREAVKFLAKYAGPLPGQLHVLIITDGLDDPPIMPDVTAAVHELGSNFEEMTSETVITVESLPGGDSSKEDGRAVDPGLVVLWNSNPADDLEKEEPAADHAVEKDYDRGIQNGTARPAPSQPESYNPPVVESRETSGVASLAGNNALEGFAENDKPKNYDTAEEGGLNPAWFLILVPVAGFIIFIVLYRRKYDGHSSSAQSETLIDRERASKTHPAIRPENITVPALSAVRENNEIEVSKEGENKPVRSGFTRLRLSRAGKGIRSLQMIFLKPDSIPSGERSIIEKFQIGIIKTMGPSWSTFSIPFSLPCSDVIAYIIYNGHRFGLYPVHYSFFPDLQGPLKSCVGIPIRIKYGTETIMIMFKYWITSLEEINRIMRIVDTPGVPDFTY